VIRRYPDWFIRNAFVAVFKKNPPVNTVVVDSGIVVAPPTESAVLPVGAWYEAYGGADVAGRPTTVPANVTVPPAALPMFVLPVPVELILMLVDERRVTAPPVVLPIVVVPVPDVLTVRAGDKSETVP